MENKQKEIKNYWNIIKEELSKNKWALFLLCLFIVIFAFIFSWNAPASSSVTERLMMVAPFVVPFILLILFAISIGPVSRRKYENAIVGKNPWEIAEVNFRRNAIGLFILFVMIVVIPNASFLPSVFVCAVAPILFLVIASLLKRKSPKAITVGYTCLLLLLIIVVYLLFYSIFNRQHGPFLIIFSSSFLILGLVDIYKASKHIADIKKDSELQKEIIKIKKEEIT